MLDPISIGIEIAAIVSGAEASVKTIQRAIKVGKDISAIGGDIMAFMSGTAELAAKKAQVEAAAIDPDNDVDLTALAFDIVLKEKKMRDDEEYIKNMVIYELDQVDVWFAMVKKRDELYMQKAAAFREKLEEAKRKLREAQAKIAKRKARIHDIIETTVVTVCGSASIIFIIWGFVWVVMNVRY